MFFLQVQIYGKKHFELFIYNENLFYAWRDKKIIRVYVNTPATAKLAIEETSHYIHPLAFYFLPQKTLKL